MAGVTTDLAQRIATMPPAPQRAFASDNAAGAHPAVIDAIVAANVGHALAYGDDRWTAEAEATLPRHVRPDSRRRSSCGTAPAPT